MSDRMTRIVIMMALLSGVGCGSLSTPRFMMPTPQREWESTLQTAQELAASGRVIEADSVLNRFAVDFPGTPGARESLYWRSLVQLQSGFANVNGPSLMLAQYLGERDADHPIEAAALHRVALRVDSLSRTATALTSKVQVSSGEVVAAKSDTKAVVADNKDQDAEIKRLKGELASAREELERIKKKLAEPPKQPPIR
jgi:hypothetical protein